jgi:hypothetical protein
MLQSLVADPHDRRLGKHGKGPRTRADQLASRANAWQQILCANRRSRVDSVTSGVVLSAIASGAGEGLGKQLWDGVISLVHRPFRSHSTPSRNPAVAEVLPAGEGELTALQQAPGDQRTALALAEALLARANADAEFRRALQNWWQQAEPIRSSIENVTNTISGGTQQGPVLIGRDFSNITFGPA